MCSIVVDKINESYVKINCDNGTSQELFDYFSFYAHNYQFMPAFKNKIWDGKLRLYNIRTNQILHGLVGEIKKFSDDRGYDFQSNIKVDDSLNGKDIVKFIEELNLPFVPREYQIQAFTNFIKTNRMTLLSSVGSGKSLIIYMISRYLIDNGLKGLLIVPNVSLVHQMVKDFENYGWDSEKYCHCVYSGKDKTSEKPLIISTWQSLNQIKTNSYFEQYDFVINDECHLSTGKVLTSINEKCINAKYRLGTTGSLDGSQINSLSIQGLFGPIFKATTTNELITKGQLSKLNIKCLILKYPDYVCKEFRKKKYVEEIDYLVRNNTRNNFIKNLSFSLSGNTLILLNFIEKHGKDFYKLLLESNKTDRKIFFVYGDVDSKIREEIRNIVDKEKDSIVVASYATFSTGINIRNLHNIIFASPSKSRVRNVQSIGRVLRLGDDKESATLYDIVDDLRIGSYVNYTIKHFIERLKIYDSEKFKYKFFNIDL